MTLSSNTVTSRPPLNLSRALGYSIAAIILGICLYSYLNVPLEEDQKIFLASARIADRSAAVFPFNVYSSWELKPIGNRIVVYIIYKASTCISNFNTVYQFERMLKSIYALIICLITFVFAYAVNAYLKGNNKTQLLFFLWYIMLLGFFTLNSEQVFQTEEFAVLLQIAALPLVMSKRKWLNICSGIPLAFIVFIKGITIILPIQVFVFGFLLNKSYRPNVITSFISFSICFATMGLFILTFMPDELTNLRNATLFQQSFSNISYSFFGRIKVFVCSFKIVFLYAPIMFLGLIAIPIVLYTKHITLNIKLNIVLLCMISSFYVILQGKFFMYHYLVFLFPVFISIAYLLTITQEIAKGNKKQLIFISILAAPALFYSILIIIRAIKSFDTYLSILCVALILINVFAYMYYFICNKTISYKLLLIIMTGFIFINWFLYISLWGLYTKNEMKLIQEEQNACEEVKKKFNLEKEKNLLYLSDGVFTYYIDVPSANRYFFPLPLNRAKDQLSSLRGKDVFITTFNDILAYNGQYIIHQPHWFVISAFPALSQKIQNEYEIVYQNLPLRRNIVIYKRKS